MDLAVLEAIMTRLEKKVEAMTVNCSAKRGEMLSQMSELNRSLVIYKTENNGRSSEAVRLTDVINRQATCLVEMKKKVAILEHTVKHLQGKELRWWEVAKSVLAPILAGIVSIGLYLLIGG